MPVEKLIVAFKREYPNWGAPKTVHAVLDRHDLVTHRRGRRHRAEGTPLTHPVQPNDLWCADRRKVNLSQVFAGQPVGVRQVTDRIWLVRVMDFDLGYFDDETCRLEPSPNPFGPKVLPTCPE